MRFQRRKDGEKPDIRISVRELVEFLRRGGDIDQRISAKDQKDAMLKGAQIHRKLQKSMGKAYESEVPLDFFYETETYTLRVEGRADGVLRNKEGVVIDEIKGVLKPLAHIEEPVPVHLAQAMCYAYMLSVKEGLSEIGVQITYVHMDTEEIKRFTFDYTFEETEAYFRELIADYDFFASYRSDWAGKRDSSMEALSFPFVYRKGQKDLVKAVYRTIESGRKLYLMAPTGVGKTMAVLYPALRAMGEGRAEKIFYLTARTVGAGAPLEAFRILAGQGLMLKTLQLTAKDKLCFKAEPACNPEDCPYAKGYYDRLIPALKEALTGPELLYDREYLTAFCQRRMICPYEFALDLSLFADAMVCDYNYVFDPEARLKRYFSDASEKNHIFLVDEAHNLVDRGRAMYSAALMKEEVLAARKLVKELRPRTEKALSKLNKILLTLKKDCESWKMIEGDAGLSLAAFHAAEELDRLFEETQDLRLRESLLDFYFDLRKFVNVAEERDENYCVYSEVTEEGHFRVRIFCIDPSERIRDALRTSAGTVFFSATLLPIRYFRSLLGAEEDDYAVYAPSPFELRKRKILIAGDVSSRYTRRNPAEYRKIASYISRVIHGKTGNYLVFFPSHKMMKDVFEIYRAEFDEPSVNWVVQSRMMFEDDREIFLENFDDPGEKTMVGFCVMGGLFAEGIDLAGERLIGAIIVGTGLPQISAEGEILKKMYEERGENGFDYAYRFPGMNKVLQAGGRVIRTEEDQGITVLLDDRFTGYAYQNLFPREWCCRNVVRADTIEKEIRAFWDASDECPAEKEEPFAEA